MTRKKKPDFEVINGDSILSTYLFVGIGGLKGVQTRK